MAQLISQSHALCIQTFQQLCKAVADSERFPESFQLALLDELDKYRIWSGNLGASHAGRTYKLSLDYRLREATFYKDQVISMVDALQRHVEDARQIVCDERKPFEDFSESDSDEESPSLSPSNETPYSKGHDSPWGSSSESGSLPDCEPSKVEPKTSDEISGLLPPATELAQLLEAIKLTIRSLYKLPIRKPAPVDRLKGNLTDAISCYQPFDCMYVRDKFPCLSREVADRIGSHITRRRQLLLYRQEHQELLRPKKVHNEPRTYLVSTESQNIHIKQHLVKKGDETHSAQIHHATTSQTESKTENLRSKATTFLHDGKQPFQPDFLSAPSVAESISQTSIAASQFTREMPVEVPSRPKDLNGTRKTMFECKFCILTTYIDSDRAWKKHVLSDLQPYVCTFPECNLGDHMFATRDAWFQHEMQMHRVEYFCNTEAHPAHRNLSEFKDHIQQEHDISLENLTNPAAMNMFRRPVSSSEGICNLCFREQPVKNMKSHVSKHLEQVSLFAIPRAEYGEDDVGAKENQSYQAQHTVEESISRDEDLKDPIFRNGSPSPLKQNFSRLNPVPDGPNQDWNKMVDVAEQEYLNLPDHHPDQEKRLGKLIHALYQRYMASRNLSDLEIVSALSDVQLSLLPVDSPERDSLMAFQLVLRGALRQFIPEGQQNFTREDATELDATEDFATKHLPGPQEFEEMLASNSQNPSVRMWYARSMLAQYWTTADPGFLNKAYLWAVEVVHSESLVDSSHLVQFGIILAEKFSQWGSLSDLDEAVRYVEQGVQNAEETSEKFYLIASELSNILWLRYRQLAEPKDLEKAVTEAQRAYDMAPSANVYERAYRGLSLAILRLTWIADFGISDDLKLAIEPANDIIEILRKDGNHIFPLEFRQKIENWHSLELARIRDGQDFGPAESSKSTLAMAVCESLWDILRLVVENKEDMGNMDFKALAISILALHTPAQSQEAPQKWG